MATSRLIVFASRNSPAIQLAIQSFSPSAHEFLNRGLKKTRMNFVRWTQDHSNAKNMEPLNLSEILFYNKVLAIGTDFPGCFLSPRGYAWIDMSKRTADKSNLQTVDHCLLLTCLKSPGMQANIFRGVPEASGSYCRRRGPGCAQLRHSDIPTAPQPMHQTALEILTALTDTQSRFALLEA